ncbi:TIGR03086 family metal-binding protein [Nocardioides sp. GY 10113]|uniref:TIGR03086 family metal-binding protein n=1 Tax=Nocardioides sp. GY 10113 TaxID=2569761 RepID=UPI00197E660A|nr:TIGR03086 family metal-binding protein [Nocardioides sp. GY 10113]
MIPSDPAEEHRVVAGTFTRRVRGVPDSWWDAPTPVKEWVVRDVVRHLVAWFPAFLADGAGIRLAPGPAVDDDPVGAWEQHTTSVQHLLDDPDSAALGFAHPRLPEMPLPAAIAQFYTSDVFLHTWDLARATRQDPGLDPERCRGMLAGMEPLDEMLRQSGQYGPRVPVPEDAAPVDRLIGFIGRDPGWLPDRLR